ncbi:MAG TPA: ROK family transcriptional regulator, partial [Anaerolineales bacterium]|nr:ROK family transcriptional regulator [Anaerolineales bacterium]
LRTIYQAGAISRADIARATDLTRTTVSAAVAEQIKSGLVQEIGLAPSIGGKPPILLSVVDDSRYVVGVDLADSEFRGALVNLRGDIRRRLSLPIHDQDGQAALDLVYRLIHQLVAASDRPMVGIGIGTPGLMDARRGVVRDAVNLSWRDLPLGELLEKKFGLPTYIANDCQVASLAELTFGQRKDLANLIVVKVGRGIGAGIVLDRRPYYGDDSGAGEIGHVVAQPGGLPCRCGNRGCLETVASTRALIQRAQEVWKSDGHSVLRRLAASPGEISTSTLVEALEAGDAAVGTMVAEAGAHLGRAVGHLVGGLNIHHIVIAGSMARFGQALLQPIQEHARGNVLRTLADNTHVEASRLGQDIVILGAAALLLSHELGLT